MCDLATLLQYLIKSERFAHYDGFIETGSPHPWKVKNVFVQFNDVREFHIGRWRGYWGMIADANSGINYLNSGGRDTVSVFLNPEVRKGLLRKYRMGDAEDVAGCYALVFGKLRKFQNGKKYVCPADSSWICLSMPEDFIPSTLEDTVENSTPKDEVDNGDSISRDEARIQDYDDSGAVSQVASLQQWDMESADTICNVEYETSQSECTHSQRISEEDDAAGKEISPSPASPENLTPSKPRKTSLRARMIRRLRTIMFWIK